MSFASLGRFTPRYFTLFEAMVNGIISLISVSYLVLLVYRNARDFCVLILYLGTLPHSLMSSSSTLAAHLGVSMFSIMSVANSDSFTSFQIWIPFLSFSSLITIARTYKTVLNNSVTSGYPCLAPDCRGNSFSFSQCRMIFAVGLSYMAFVRLK